jgi:hypothetical protein
MSPTVAYLEFLLSFCVRPTRCDFSDDQVREFERSMFEQSEVEKRCYIGILLGLGDEFERMELFKRSEFERTKFNCITNFQDIEAELHRLT